MSKAGDTALIHSLLLKSFLPFNYSATSATTNYRQWLEPLFKPHKNTQLKIHFSLILNSVKKIVSIEWFSIALMFCGD